MADSLDKLDIRVGRVIDVELETRTPRRTINIQFSIFNSGFAGLGISLLDFPTHEVQGKPERETLFGSGTIFFVRNIFLFQEFPYL